MIDLFPFSGFPVAVLGLDVHGLAAADALQRSGAQVLGWDEDAALRTAAEAAGVPLADPALLDWREPVSLVLEHRLAPEGDAAAAAVKAALAAGCELVSDCELLARAQRDAAYLAVVSRRGGSTVLDMLAHVFGVSGQEIEVGGDDARPLMNLLPLEVGCYYAVTMPPGRAALTRSITFDCAIYLDVGDPPWPPYHTTEDIEAACRWVFHRQTEPKAAVIDVSDPGGRRMFSALAQKREQVLIPVSGTETVEHGVFHRDGVLYDATEGGATAIAQLNVGPDEARLAAAVYAAAIAVDVPKHAAMASLSSFFIS